jgi:ABC-type multidrug transport system ATPase subunit
MLPRTAIRIGRGMGATGYFVAFCTQPGTGHQPDPASCATHSMLPICRFIALCQHSDPALIIVAALKSSRRSSTAPNRGKTMLEIRNVVKTWGKNAPAVNDVSLNLSHGVVGLIGHNGAGKTTLMQMIATLSRPTSGQILFQGVDISKKPDAIRSKLGFLPQDFGVYPNLSALEFMQYFAALKGVRDARRIKLLLEMVNLHEHANRQAASFSGGMKRRLGIAQALLNDPDILIVDEPTAGLDPEERLRFRNLLAEIGFNKLVIMSTHIVSDVESIASELAIMKNGKLIEHDSPDAIMARARGQIWSAQMNSTQYEGLRAKVHVLHAQRKGEQMALRIAHPYLPCVGAEPAEPSLEEALMSQRYAALELAA